jgi:hypothetical protein
VTPPEHELAPHVTSQLADSQSTPPEQSLPPVQASVHALAEVQAMAPEHELGPQVSAHVVASHVIGPEQAELPQLIVQLDPPQTIPPEQVLSPHSMSQLAAFEQSTRPLHPLPVVPHCTTHATPGGHTTPESHFPAQSMTQRPVASQVPFGHDCAEHVATGLLVPQAARSTTTVTAAMIGLVMCGPYSARHIDACAESHARSMNVYFKSP